MWGGQSWREIQPLFIKVSLLAAFGFTAALYLVDNRLSHYSDLCDDPSSQIYIDDAGKRREACE